MPVAVRDWTMQYSTAGDGYPAPALISWNVTLRCPLKCPHCYVDAGEREVEGVLSTEEAFSDIDQIRRTGTPVIVLSGGEPLMREDIYAIARYGTERGLRMVMGTSGFLLDRTTARLLREAGIRAVAVSIDSAVPGEHDRLRGASGVWGRAGAAIGPRTKGGVAGATTLWVRGPAPCAGGAVRGWGGCAAAGTEKGSGPGAPGRWASSGACGLSGRCKRRASSVHQRAGRRPSAPSRRSSGWGGTTRGPAGEATPEMG